MNTEAKVISAVCKNKDLGVLLEGDADDLFTTYLDVWQGIKKYYFKYRAVPNREWLQENYRDLDIYNATEQTQVYVDQLRNEYIGSRMEQLFLEKGKKLKTTSSAQVLQEVFAELTPLNKLTTGVRDLNLMDVEAAEKYYKAQSQKSDQMGGSPGIPTGFKSIDVSYPTGLLGGHLVVIIGWPGRGKRIDVNSKVGTPDGWRKYGDLVPGDYVLGRNGTSTKVTGIYSRGVGKAYKVSFNDGTSVVADPDHLWSIYCGTRGLRRDNLITLTTQEILNRGLRRDRNGHIEYKSLLPLVSPIEYDKKDLPIDPYTLGALLGDGTLGGESVYLSSMDPEIPAIISDRNPGTRVVKYNRSSGCDVYGINGMIGKIKSLGLNVHGKNKYIPNEYLISDIDSRLELLRGLMDTDGSVMPGRRAIFTSYTPALAEGVAELVRSLGGVARVDLKKNGIEYSVVFWLEQNPFNLKRKSRRYSPRPWFKAIKSIDECEDAEMMCISVDALDSLYVIQDYTVTHNTWFSGYLACKAWEQGFKPMIVSLEMSPENMRDRIYTMMGSGLFRASDFSRGDINLDDFGSWSRKKFDNKNDFVIVSSEGSSSVTPSTVQAKIDQYHPDLVICDYHQLFDDNAHSRNEVERGGNVSKEFKRLAMSNNIPIIDITAATMEDVSSQDTAPMLSQVRWSKSIEYDADMAVAVHKQPDSNIIEVVSRKNRHGSDFAVYLDWDIDRGIISEMYGDD